LKFSRPSGEVLLSTSFDGSAKLWSSRSYQPLSTLVGHQGIVLGGDLAMTEKQVITVGYDRTVKVWAKDLLAL